MFSLHWPCGYSWSQTRKRSELKWRPRRTNGSSQQMNNKLALRATNPSKTIQNRQNRENSLKSKSRSKLMERKIKRRRSKKKKSRVLAGSMRCAPQRSFSMASHSSASSFQSTLSSCGCQCSSAKALITKTRR